MKKRRSISLIWTMIAFKRVGGGEFAETELEDVSDRLNSAKPRQVVILSLMSLKSSQRYYGRYGFYLFRI